MRIEITDAPCKEDEAFVIAQTRKYNSAFTENDHRSLCVFARDEVGNIIGGLTGRTYWQYLDIAFLWVDEKYRGEGYATKLMKAAEAEACARGCERCRCRRPAYRRFAMTAAKLPTLRTAKSTFR
jgi:GNAT superfamily N-acetyltransferase